MLSLYTPITLSPGPGEKGSSRKNIIHYHLRKSQTVTCSTNPPTRIMTDPTDVQNSPSSSTESPSSPECGDMRPAPPAFNRKDSCTHAFPSRRSTTGLTAPRDGISTSRDGHKRTGSNVKPTFLATPFEDINRLFSGLDWILEVASQSDKSK